MPGLMFDSDNPEVLLQAALAGCRIATYADLVTPQLLQQAGGRLVVIDRGHGDPHNVATVADIESGLLTVDQGLAKIKQWNAEHRPYPTAYHDRNDWAAVVAGVHGFTCWNWVATLDGTANPNGARPAVVQILGEGALGFHADLSVVWDDNWHPVPAAVTAAEVARVKSLAAILGSEMSALQAAVAAI